MFTRKKTKKIFLTSVHIISSLIIAFTLTFSPFASPRPPAPVEAAGAFATEFTQLANVAQNEISALEARIQTGLQGQTAMATVGNFLKENVLDGIGWTIAKTALSSMIRSLINWVNSGFQGSPAFITDLKQHLINTLDQAAGEFISSLGGIGEFICSPFRLDVQAALAINYQQARTGMPSGGDQNMCRLSDIGSNIENFFDGMSNDWNDWLRVTSNPQNTPLGAYFAAEASLNARLINEAGTVMAEANWGQGFLSQKVCETSESGQQQSCRIVTPGQIIADQVNGAVGSGRDVLIQADEINELIGALLNQLVLQVMGGVNGLLGLSQDSGSGSYLDQMVDEMSQQNIDLVLMQIEQSIKLEQVNLEMTDNAIQIAQLLLNSDITGPDDIETNASPAEVEQILIEAQTLRPRIIENLDTLERLNNTLNNGVVDEEGFMAFNEFTELLNSNTLSTEASLNAQYISWSSILTTLPPPNITTSTLQ